MDDENQLNKLEDYQKPEVIVDFNDDPYGKIKININYKEKLAQKRKKLDFWPLTFEKDQYWLWNKS